MIYYLAMNKSNYKKGEKTFWEELVKRKKFFCPKPLTFVPKRAILYINWRSKQ